MLKIRQKINRKKDCFLEYKRFDFDIILGDSPYMFNNKSGGFKNKFVQAPILKLTSERAEGII